MSSKRAIFGLILVLLGLLLLGRTFDLYYFSARDFFSLLLPALLIVVGFWLIVRKKRQEDLYRQEAEFQRQAGHGAAEVTSGAAREDSETTHRAERVRETPNLSQPGRAKYSKVLGDMFIDCRDIDLQSVEISTGVGDAEVKLHGGKLASGLNRMVISGFLGDIRVLVPQDMPVFAQCSNFIGDVELLGKQVSGFGNNLDGQTATYSEASSKLYIAISNFIGDVRVYVA